MDSRDEGAINKIAGDSPTHQQPQNDTSPPPCARLCGFYGNPATHNLCSKCFRDYLKEKEQVKLAVKNKKALAVPVSPVTAADDATTITITKKNRCQSCNKKVGLTGFNCRCGGMFCGIHRYPEAHACEFDFKIQSRAALAKQNPLCIADKLDNRI